MIGHFGVWGVANTEPLLLCVELRQSEDAEDPLLSAGKHALRPRSILGFTAQPPDRRDEPDHRQLFDRR